MENCSDAGMIARSFKYFIYTTDGCFMIVCNSLLVLTIFKQNALRLRKEYIVIGALALGDALNGCALVTAGIYRSYMIFSRHDGVLISKFHCLLTPHCFIWLFTDPVASCMLLAVSCDRLLCVSFPAHYMKLDSNYAWALVGCVYFYSLVHWTVGFYLTYHSSTDAIYGSLCFTSWSLVPGFSNYHDTLIICSATLSVLLYGLVWRVYMRQKRQVHEEEDLSSRVRRESRMERKLTISVGISALATLVLYVFPSGLDPLSHHLQLSPEVFAAMQVYPYAVSQLNPILNLFIYVIRLSPIRQGLKFTLCCKGQLPLNLDLMAKRKSCDIHI